MKLTYRHTTYACYLGGATQAIINNLAPLLFIIFQTRFGISFEMVGRLILINFATQMVTDIITVKYADKMGYRNALCAAHVFCMLGLLGLGIFPNILPDPYIGLCISVIIYALGGGLIEVLVSPVVESLPGEEKASAMSILHSFYCWGQVCVVLVSTLLLSVIGNHNWFVLPILWSVVPFLNFFFFMRVPMVPPVPDHEKMPIRKLLRSKLFLIAMLLMVCAGASEIAMSQWSSLFAERGLGVAKVFGDLLGPCLFAILMGTGRLLYGLFGSRIKLKRALICCAVLCIICYLVTALVKIPIISLMGCALCGLSVSLMWPGTFSYTAECYPKGGTAMFGILAIMGDLGCSVGPWLAGAVSDAAQQSKKLVEFGAANGLQPDQMGLKIGLLLAVIFPIMMLVGVILMKREKEETGKSLQ